jgi:hypothetical protein
MAARSARNRLVLLGSIALVPLGAAAAGNGNELQPFADAASSTPLAPWHVVGLPQQDPQAKPFTRFSVETVKGKRALRVDAERSYGNLVHPLNGGSGRTLSWAWRIEKLNDASDLTVRSGDDTTLKVCASFDLPLDKVPFIERQLLRAARGKTTEPVPSATLCYVWDNKLPVGTFIDSPFTRRLRYIVLQSGEGGMGEWHTEKRDLQADFRKAFVDESPDTVPPITAVAVGADADNTKNHTVGQVADIVLSP